jgi:hypothetical protein
VAIKSGICPAQIVGHDKNDIGFCRKGSVKQTKGKNEMIDNFLRAKIHKVVM